MRLFNILALLALVASSQAAETHVRSLQGPGDGEGPGGDGGGAGGDGGGPGGDGGGPGGDGGAGGGGGEPGAGADSDPPSTVPTLSPAPAGVTVTATPSITAAPSTSDPPSAVPSSTPGGTPSAPSSPSAPSPSTSSVESWTLGWTGLALAVAPLMV